MMTLKEIFAHTANVDPDQEFRNISLLKNQIIKTYIFDSESVWQMQLIII